MTDHAAPPRGWIGHHTPEVAVVVPCYNEAERLDPTAFVALVDHDEMALVFVDDGSTDGTSDLLLSIQAMAPDRIEIITLDHNAGKAAAVASGLRVALGAGAVWVGYLDADLAVPVDEWLRICEHRSAEVDGILASRVRLLGRSIDRKLYRHLIGRIFATYASALLDLPVYDTQCGGKLFRGGPALEAALLEPFITGWLFDVELLARLLYPADPSTALLPDRFVEVPLRRWTDVTGSALTTASAPTILGQVIRLTRDVRQRRNRAKALSGKARAGNPHSSY